MKKELPYKLRDVKREDRKNLPEEIKMIYFLTLKGFDVGAELVEDCYNKYPDYFEMINDKRLIE